MPSPIDSTSRLPQRLGLVGATATGLGAILGTGVFVTLPTAAEQIGPHIIWAILLAALTAAFNALSSAQLAAAIPVSGGTYEYGYRLVHPLVGFLAGWLFLCAKTASAATAALGLALYLQSMFPLLEMISTKSIAVTITLLLTTVTWLGLRFSLVVSMSALFVTLLALLMFSLTGLLSAPEKAWSNKLLEAPDSWFNLLSATALIFVAYTGYGRIATMGEEVLQPRKTIPRAILTTLILSAVVYLGVACATLSYLNSDKLLSINAASKAPLVSLASRSNSQLFENLLSTGAVTAVLCVELNLLLGISRVLLAMARRGDMPPLLKSISKVHETPQNAVVATGLLICTLIFVGDISTNWSFSALTVLIYYSITNFCLLKLPKTDRLFPAWPAWLGLIACTSLAFFIPLTIWYLGITIAATGFLWKGLANHLATVGSTFSPPPRQ